MLRDCSDIEVVVPVVINVLDYLQSGFAGSVCMKASSFQDPAPQLDSLAAIVFIMIKYRPVESSANLLTVQVGV